MNKRIFIVVVFLICAFASSIYATDLSDVGNNVIRDTDNSLEWINHTFIRRNWTAQTAAVAALTYNGIGDWRLPTKTELLTLVSSTYDPKIDPLFNLGSVANWTCWSSTAAGSGRSVLTKKYAVFFGNGRALTIPYRSKKAALYVRDYGGGWLWNNGNEIVWNAATTMDLN